MLSNTGPETKSYEKLNLYFRFYIATIAGHMVTRRRLAPLERVFFLRSGEALYSRGENFVKSFIPQVGKQPCGLI